MLTGVSYTYNNKQTQTSFTLASNNICLPCTGASRVFKGRGGSKHITFPSQKTLPVPYRRVQTDEADPEYRKVMLWWKQHASPILGLVGEIVHKIDREALQKAQHSIGMHDLTIGDTFLFPQRRDQHPNGHNHQALPANQVVARVAGDAHFQHTAQSSTSNVNHNACRVVARTNRRRKRMGSVSTLLHACRQE